MRPPDRRGEAGAFEHRHVGAGLSEAEVGSDEQEREVAQPGLPLGVVTGDDHALGEDELAAHRERLEGAAHDERRVLVVEIVRRADDGDDVEALRERRREAVAGHRAHSLGGGGLRHDLGQVEEGAREARRARDQRAAPSPVWGAKLLTVEGEKLSLDDIEHRILRPIWQDERIHYAVNCASLGCPNLPAAAYTSENTAALLEQGAKEYINHTRGVALTGGKLRVSSIYVWFQEDFGGDAEGLMEHWQKYANPPLAGALEKYKGGLSHDYDWRLNGVDAKP
jgi:hypothetical protein